MTNKQFEDWFNAQNFHKRHHALICNGDFDKFPFCMRYGIYLAYFDAHDIIITIGNQYQNWACQIVYSINGSDFFRVEIRPGHTREETQIEAIEKAFELQSMIGLGKAGVNGAKAGEELRKTLTEYKYRT